MYGNTVTQSKNDLLAFLLATFPHHWQCYNIQNLVFFQFFQFVALEVVCECLQSNIQEAGQSRNI